MAKCGGFKAAEMTVVAVLAIVICVGMSSAEDSLCNDAVGFCLDFTTGAIDKPTPECCDALRRLSKSIVGYITWQHACNCYPAIRDYSSNVLKDDRVRALPSRCVYVSFPFQLSMYANCTGDVF